MSDALFDLPNVRHVSAEVSSLSPQQKLTRRQHDLLGAGLHPLSVVLSTPLRLHQDAAPAQPKDAPGLRCGTCKFRELLQHHDRSYAKCLFGEGVRSSHGPATDVRAYWSACVDYQPKTTKASPGSPATGEDYHEPPSSGRAR